MTRFLLLGSGLILLAGCTTPETVLKHPDTQQVARCGGDVGSSLIGGAIGYHIQKSNDKDCVRSYMEQGFVPVKVTTEDDK